MSKFDNFTLQDKNCIILMRDVRFSRTESGKSWRKNPDTITRRVVSPKFYENYVQSIPFFRNWGDGASCRAQYNYTMAGLIPVRIMTVAPYKNEHIIAEFTFINKSHLLDAAGWREKKVLKNAVSYRIERYIDNEYRHHRRITFITEDTGWTASATCDEGVRKWIG